MDFIEGLRFNLFLINSFLGFSTWFRSTTCCCDGYISSGNTIFIIVSNKELTM